MKKELLNEFIKKYSLNGLVEKCRWLSCEKDKTLSVSIASDNRDIISMVKMNEWDGFGDAEIGIGSTKVLKTKLSALSGDDINFVLNKSNDGSYYSNMEVSDGKCTSIISCAELDIMPQSVSIKKKPVSNAEIIIDKEFVDIFLNAQRCFSEVHDVTALMSKKGKLELVIGYNNININRFVFDNVKCNKGMESVVKPIHFSAESLKEVLSANSEVSDTILYLSDSGYASLSFKTGCFECSYYMADNTSH